MLRISWGKGFEHYIGPAPGIMNTESILIASDNDCGGMQFGGKIPGEERKYNFIFTKYSGSLALWKESYHIF